MPPGVLLRTLAAMYVIHHSTLMAPTPGDTTGEMRYCAIGPALGVHDFQLWVHTLPPGAHTPVQQHTGCFACVVLAGSGKLLVNGGPLRFQSPCTLVVPPDSDFQIANNAAVPLRLVSVFTAAPAPR